MTTAASLGWIVLVTAGFLALPAMTRPTLPFGVRVPHGRAVEPALRRIRLIYSAIVAVLGLVAAIIAREAAVSALVVVDLLAYWTASRMVANAKRAGEWTAGLRQGVAVDTTLRTKPVRLPVFWLVPSTVVLIGTAVLGAWNYGTLPGALPVFDGLVVDESRRVATMFWSAWWPVADQLVATAVAVLAAIILPRTRPELDAAQPETSAQRYRAYLSGVLRWLAVVVAAANIALLVIALQLWGVVVPSPVWMIVAAVPLALAFAGAVVWMARVGDVGHRLPGEEKEDSGLTQRDDDRHWYLAGTVYLNRADPALLVHQRVGTRWVLNLGHPIAWLVLVGLAVFAALVITKTVQLPG